MPVEKSGIHITGADSGWPVGNVAAETPHTKAGNGTDGLHKVLSVAGGAVQDASSVDEVQTITRTGTVTGGTFELGLVIDGEKETTTAALPGAATLTAAQIQTALENLDGVDGGDVVVAGAAGGPFTVAFGGRFADQNVPALTVESSAVTGGGSITIATTTPGVD